MKRRRVTMVRRSGVGSHLGALARRSGLVLFVIALTCGAALSLRIPIPARIVPYLPAFGNTGRLLAEHGLLPPHGKSHLDRLLANSPAGFVPMGMLTESHGLAFGTPSDPENRAKSAAELLARARAPLAVGHVPGNSTLLSLVETIDAATGVTFTREVVTVLPGERVRLQFPDDTEGLQTLEMRVECLGATADRLDALARGRWSLHSGEERVFEVSPRGETAVLAVDGRAGDVHTLEWPESAPGFLVLEGWRDRRAMASPDATARRGLLIVSIDALAGTPDLELLPRTRLALEKGFGAGNVGTFARVMPSSTDADAALASLFTGDFPSSQATPENSSRELFALAGKRGLPSIATKIEPFERTCGELNLGPCRTSPVTRGESRVSTGEPLALVKFPRREEIGNALHQALEAFDGSQPALGVVRIRFPEERLKPTWTSALTRPGSGFTSAMLAGSSAFLFGTMPSPAVASHEKHSQIDDALASFLGKRPISQTNNVAIFVASREEGRTRAGRSRPAPPVPGFIWLASSDWNGNAPRTDALLSARDLHAGFAALIESDDSAPLASVAAGGGTSTHTVTASAEGTWHLFPYGKVLVPDEGTTPRPPAIWDVPLERTRETQAAIQGHRASLKENAIHFFFPPNGVQERVSASLQWPLEPISCGVVSHDDAAGAEGEGGRSLPQARGVVEFADKNERGRSGGYRLWFTAVASPRAGAHVVCAFQGGARPGAEIEMHFERGSRSLGLETVGLGEFALPIPALESGVQLAQARFDDLAGLMGAQFPPAWKALKGYSVHLWEDSAPGSALLGLEPLDLRRRDRETEEERKQGDEDATPRGARFAEDRP